MKLYARRCTGRFARWMASRGWGGVTLVTPFRWVVILYWVEPHGAIVRHEYTHYQQACRWGFWGWWARYLWGLRRGYKANPLEVEARAAASEE